MVKEDAILKGLLALEDHSLKKRRIGVFLLGVLLSLGFAPFDIPFVVFILIPLLLVYLSTAESPKQAAMEGWLFGFGHFITSLYWIAESFGQQQQVPAWLGPIAVVILVAILALYFALLFYLNKSLWSRYKMGVWSRLILFASLWVVVEQVRGVLFTGFPWNPLGMVWVSIPALAQTASLWGVYGLSFITVMLAASPLLAISSPFAEKLSIRSLLVPLAVGLFVISFGVIRLSIVEINMHDSAIIRLIQPNISQLDKWDDNKREDNFYDHINLSLGIDTKSDLKGGPTSPTHIIWSESAITYLIDRRPDLRKSLADMLADGQVLITGAPRLTRENGTLEAFNSVFVFNDKGLITNRYDKSHLVPFGEYVPLRGLLSAIGLEKMVPGALDFSSGPGPQTLNIKGLPPVSPLICYEIIFPGNVVDPENRPEWLLNITNDGWFGTSSGPYQHFAMAQMRAIEEGIPVVRNAGSGISGVINPLGQVQDQLDLNHRGMIDVKLPQKLVGHTIYSLSSAFYLIVFLAISFFIVLTYHYRKD